MKISQKYRQIIGLIVCLISVLLAIVNYQSYRVRQKYLREGKLVQAYLGIKSKNWEDTPDFYWEVSYWVSDKRYQSDRLVKARIEVNKNLYYRYEEDEKVRVYYLKSAPHEARLQAQVEQKADWWWAVVCGGLGIFLLLSSRRFF